MFRTKQFSTFEKSNTLKTAFNSLIPGGAHTYAKGDDQFPEGMAPYIVKGKGCHVWDVDGNKYIEYAMGLRSVTLGHAIDPIVEAASQQMHLGTNFGRPGIIELECAEEFLGIIRTADMVKFAKNGSDVTSAAILLARAYTGRDMVAICGDQPFFSCDGWFMGTTPVNSGVPKAIQDLTVKFRYNDIESARALFEKYPNQIACIILEAEKETPPLPGFLQSLKELCEKNGAVFILDEIITGFRWDIAGAQKFHGVEPHLSTFGKAIANGFSVSALAGKKEIMELGGLNHDKDRVFLLSTTYGAETHGLGAAIATMKFYQDNQVIERIHTQGAKLKKSINTVIETLDLKGHFNLIGRPWCLVYSTCDQSGRPSQAFRTLFLQETIKRGLIAPSLIISYSHTDADIDKTVEIVYESLIVYKKALEEGIDRYLVGRPVKPVYRKKN
jgi:glutamate-1-semialdehyde 2,1-aminomutase